MATRTTNVARNRPTGSTAAAGEDVPADAGDLNEVRLTGRVSGMPQTRLLPSGDELVAFRLVVARHGAQPRGAPTVDTLDIACWSGRTRQRARPLVDGDRVRVVGTLRRRFFRTGGSPVSRYEVSAEVVSRLR